MSDDASKKDLDEAEAQGLRGESDLGHLTSSSEEDAARDKGRAKREAMKEANEDEE